MADFTIKRRDTLPPIAATLADADGPIDLTGATVRFHLRNINGTSTVVDAAATVVSAAAGTVRYDWTVDDTATAGNYVAEWEITFGDGTEMTCPNTGHTSVAIIEDIA